MPIALATLIHKRDYDDVAWVIELVPYGDGAVALLPDELLESTGWKAGDELNWEAKKGSIVLTGRVPDDGPGTPQSS